ncbi:hypothetical protein [Brevibacillus fulvus]|uniref:Uncharacterized protein n=1 Tax=Brevibacillus fulvus TaxID=1125967 RepID=A0A939BSR9_9BACL|nr:hypothetical protein [Brevibacillus fulvus]MBM7590763.1 hypothetical protein [Brevibacillus fulvus]
MARLEYRLLDEQKQYPVLYYYNSIDNMEMAMRFACDYLVKDHRVYEKMSCAMEQDVGVIYVKISSEEQAVDYWNTAANRWGQTQIELRHFREGTVHYPLLHTHYFRDEKEALLHLLSDYLYWDGQEWEKTSAEIDEDREVYILYVRSSEEGEA